MHSTPEQDERFSQLSQQRIDYIDLPNGGQRAILTVTLPGGKQYTYSADVSAAEAAKVEGLYDEVGSLFGDIGKRLGKIAKGAVKAVRGVASSKVFALAAKGLAMVAPALGPLAPAALATSATMGIAGKLSQARVAGARGNKKLAAQITASAVKSAHAIAPKNAKTLLALANTKSARAVNVPLKSSSTKSSSKPKSLPASTSSASRVNSKQLLAAARKGQVYLLRAA